MKRLILLTLALCVAAATAAAQEPQQICGPARVVDGDGLVIGSTSFRFYGIDAPETAQWCYDAGCQPYTCGIDSREKLKDHIAGREVCCVDKGSGAFGRRAAVCSVDGEDLNAWSVRMGLARAWAKYSPAYVRDEDDARKAGRGMWSGAFIAP